MPLIDWQTPVPTRERRVGSSSSTWFFPQRASPIRDFSSPKMLPWRNSIGENKLGDDVQYFPFRKGFHFWKVKYVNAMAKIRMNHQHLNAIVIVRATHLPCFSFTQLYRLYSIQSRHWDPAFCRLNSCVHFLAALYDNWQLPKCGKIWEILLHSGIF